jgi:hypothetical protein
MKLYKIKLLPCKKCKQDNMFVKTEKENNQYKSYVWCLSCQYCSETTSHKNKKEAEIKSIELWNGIINVNKQIKNNDLFSKTIGQNKAYGLKICHCPKCGEKRLLINSSAYDFGQRYECYVSCPSCFYKGLIIKEHTKKLSILKSIQFWNTNKEEINEN